VNRLKRKRRDWISKQKIKLILSIILSVFAIFLWGRILLIEDNNEPVTISKAEKKSNATEKIDNQIKDANKTKHSKISNQYKINNIERKSPFAKQSNNRLEFSYNNKVEEDKNNIHQLNSSNSSFSLVGVTKKGESSLALLKAEDRVYLLKKGEELEGFIVQRIDNKEIILLKDDIEYKLDIIKYSF
jgi:Tfp pilus assembly protein PilP